MGRIFAGIASFTRSRRKSLLVTWVILAILSAPAFMALREQSGQTTSGEPPPDAPSSLAMELFREKFPEQIPLSAFLVMHSEEGLDREETMLFFERFNDSLYSASIPIWMVYSVYGMEISLQQEYDRFEVLFNSVLNSTSRELVNMSYFSLPILVDFFHSLLYNEIPNLYNLLWWNISRTVFYLNAKTTAYDSGLNQTDIDTVQNWTYQEIPPDLINQTYQLTDITIPLFGHMGKFMYTSPTYGNDSTSALTREYLNYLFEAIYNLIVGFDVPESLNETLQPLMGNFLGNDTQISSSDFSMIFNLLGGSLGDPTPYKDTFFHELIMNYGKAFEESYNTYIEVPDVFKSYSTVNFSLAYASQINGLSNLSLVVPSAVSGAFNKTHNSTLDPAIKSLLEGFSQVGSDLNNTEAKDLSTVLLASFLSSVNTLEMAEQFGGEGGLSGVSIDPQTASMLNLSNALDISNVSRGIMEADTPEKRASLSETISKNISRYVLNEFPRYQFPDNMPTYATEELLSPDGKTMLIIILFPDSIPEEDAIGHTSEIRSLASAAQEFVKTTMPDLETYLTGEVAFSYDFSHALEEDIQRTDTIVIPLIFVLVGLIFLSFVTPVIPILAMGIALLVASAVLFIVSGLGFEIPGMVQTILTVVLFGAGVDYCIFMMARYREEREKGVAVDDAVDQAVEHAGESVVSSGLTVMVGFGSLLISSLQLTRSLGLGPMIAILFSLITALTFLPTGMRYLGDKMFYPQKLQPETGSIPQKSKLSRLSLGSQGELFRKLAFWTTQNPWKVIIGFLIIFSPFFFFATQLQLAYDVPSLLPEGLESVTGFEAITAGGSGKGFAQGEITSFNILVSWDTPISSGIFSDSEKLESIAEIHRKVTNLSEVAYVKSVVAPRGKLVNYSHYDSVDPINKSLAFRYVSTDNTTIFLKVVLGVNPFDEDVLPIADDFYELLSEVNSTHPAVHGAVMRVQGSVPLYRDLMQYINKESIVFYFLVLSGVFLVLLLVLGSVFTPIRLELTILASVVITLGACHIFFTILLGKGIPYLVPVTVTVLLFGLGMDYDIFIVTRMREEVEKGATDAEAIVIAIEKTGSVITAAGIIMALTLGVLMLSGSLMLKVMGFAFFFSILLDATVVRIFLVPAVMVVMEKWNWWAPGPLQRVKRE